MQAYILRRDGRDYQAPDLETLRAWARDGRVLPGDMVYSPRYQSWYRARDLRELRSVLPSQEPAPRSSARQQFWLRKGDQNYATDSLETILRWASEGNIDPDDYIYHPSYGKWFRAGDSPQLASRFPSHFKQRNEAYGREGGEEATSERADSVARTAVDLPAEQIRQALLERLKPAVGPGEVPEPRDTRPVMQSDLASIPQDAIQLRDTEAQPELPAAQPERAEEGPEEAAEVVEDAPHPPAMEVDRDARFNDRFGAMKLFYDCARVFVVTRDLRPGEVLETDCSLASTGDAFRSRSKREIYATLAERMKTHLEGKLAEIGTSLPANERPGYHLLLSRIEVLLEAMRKADPVIGQKPPERFIIGNQGRPKMTPAEEEAMLKIDAALTGVISARKR
jgi:hypothetical protein